jgi:putative transposase
VSCVRSVRGVWSLIRVIVWAARSFFRTKRELALENLALRHQIGVLTRALGDRRPRFGNWDRALWVVLARRWEAWRYALAIVQPATVARWHREGFKRFWSRRSRAGRGGRPALNREQQLSTVLQKRRPRIGLADRAFWVVLRRVWARWSDAVVIVKPETVIGWHRAGFALYWKWLSRPRRSPGRAAVGREVQDLVRRMARENGWGAPRIHGELLKLGFRVSERTVSRYMRRLGRSPERRQSWFTFLRNHREVIVAMDFFAVPTATFRVLYVWFAIRHSRREIVHWSVTESPTAPWVVQQLREAFPFDGAGGRLRHLVLDRDTIFSAAVVAAIASMGLEPTRTSYESPWQNGVAERFVGTVRRDLLDHAIVLDDEHR